MKYFCWIIVSILVFNCSGIPKYKKNDFKHINNVKQIEGEFNNYDNDSLMLMHNSFNGRINWRNKHLDTTQFSSVVLKILSEKRLKLDFIVNDSVKKSRILKYRLRNNGFIKLRNQNLRIQGIPYIFGGYDNMKYELGLTKTNNLILHGSYEQAGGLIIILSNGRAYTVNSTYQRI